MKVREAIEKLQQMDPEALFVTHGSDHTFVNVFHFEQWHAEDAGELVEAYDEDGDSTADAEPNFGGKIVPVVCIAE
jgi:hypothetical protein